MINLRGSESICGYSLEDLRKLGIQSVSTISEATWAPRIIIKHLDGKEELIKLEGRNINDAIKSRLKEIVKEQLIEQRKEKLNQLK